MIDAALDAPIEAPGAPAYPAAILGDGPLVYWRMGIKTGTRVLDETGGGNDLVLQGGGHVLGVTGAIVSDTDTAIRFDGTTSFAIATNSRVLDFTNAAAFTLECWAERAANGGGYYQHLLSNLEGPANSREGYSLYLLPNPVSPDSARSAFEYDQRANEVGIFAALPAVSTWAHFAAVFDGRTAAFYVDGTLSGTRMITGSFGARTTPFTLARASSETAHRFAGALDEVAVYGAALTAAQIARHVALGQQR